VNLLLDTHSFLWLVLDDSKLSRNAWESMRPRDNHLYLSPASFWELAIKVQLGKYQLNVPFREFIDMGISLYSLEVLPIMPAHAAEVATLPRHHGDPFDRMMIAQAMVEQMAIVSADEAFDVYPVTRIW